MTARLTLTLLLLVACSPKQGGDSESASTGETADTSETLGHSSAPTVPTVTGETATGGLPNGTEGPTTTTGTAPNDGTTTVVETSEFGSSSVDPVGPTLCESVCELALMCDPNHDETTCVLLCEGELAEASPACAAATETMLQCFTGLTCEQFALAQNGQLENPCGPEQIDRNTACGGGPDTCDTGGGGDVNGEACSIETQCPGDPLRRMECDTELCLCFEDNAQIGSCPADGACTTLSELGTKALSCCGFPDVGPDVGP